MEGRAALHSGLELYDKGLVASWELAGESFREHMGLLDQLGILTWRNGGWGCSNEFPFSGAQGCLRELG